MAYILISRLFIYCMAQIKAMHYADSKDFRTAKIETTMNLQTCRIPRRLWAALDIWIIVGLETMRYVPGSAFQQLNSLDCRRTSPMRPTDYSSCQCIVIGDESKAAELRGYLLQTTSCRHVIVLYQVSLSKIAIPLTQELCCGLKFIVLNEY